MKKLKYLMTAAILLVLLALIYYVAVNKDDEDSSGNDTEVTEIAKVLSMDLEKNYPSTAREVMNFFIRIQKCYYNEEHDDSELVKLAYKAMELFDDELVEKNPFDTYYAALTEEIDDYAAQKKVINKTILDKAAEVIYSEIDGVRYATMKCIYYLKTDTGTEKVVQKYALRCDANGQWKILGWEIYEPSEYEE